MGDQIAKNKHHMKENTFQTCEDRKSNKPDDFFFAPVQVGDLDTKGKQVHTTEGRCFKDIRIEGQLEKVHDGHEYRVTAHMENPKHWNCKEIMLFGSENIIQVENYFFHGTHHLTFKNIKE